MDVVGFRKRNFFYFLFSVSFLFFRKCNFFFSVSFFFRECNFFLCYEMKLFMLFYVVFFKFYKVFINLVIKLNNRKL